MNLNVEYIFKAVDKMTPAVKRMSSNFKMSMKDMAFYAQYYSSVAMDKLKGFTRNLKQTGKSMIDFGKKIKWVSVGAGVGVWKALKESMNFEDSQVMFEVLLKSADKAKKLINEIDVMAKKTPLGNKALRQSAQILVAYGASAEEIMPMLRMLGDISLGNSEKFKVLTYNMAQVQKLGKLTAIDLRSLALSGFNPLADMGEKLGIKYDVMQKHMAAGNITFKMVMKAMKDATSEGGTFYEALKRKSETAGGALDEFLDTFNQVARGIGDTLKPAFESVTRKMTVFLEWFKETSPWLRKLVGWVLVLVAVLSPLIIMLGALAISLAFISWPLLLIVGAVALVIAGFMYWQEIILGLDSFLKMLWEDLKVIGNWLKDTFLGIIDSISSKFKKMGEWIEKAKFWKKDLDDDEILEVNKNIKGIGGDNKFDIMNLLTIENKNNSNINYSPIKATGAGQSMAYGL